MNNADEGISDEVISVKCPSATSVHGITPSSSSCGMKILLSRKTWSESIVGYFTSLYRNNNAKNLYINCVV